MRRRYVPLVSRSVSFAWLTWVHVFEVFFNSETSVGHVPNIRTNWRSVTPKETADKSCISIEVRYVRNMMELFLQSDDSVDVREPFMWLPPRSRKDAASGQSRRKRLGWTWRCKCFRAPRCFSSRGCLMFYRRRLLLSSTSSQLQLPHSKPRALDRIFPQGLGCSGLKWISVNRQTWCHYSQGSIVSNFAP